MEQFYSNLTHRTELVIGKDCLAKITQAKVIIFGIGGVGSWCAEALVRSGIMHLTVVDSDLVCPTNLNRQAQATFSTIGNVKVDEMKRRLLDINPHADITAINRPYTAETGSSFELASFDYVIDAIDSVSNKLHLLETCLDNNIKVFSSMGAGAKTDPSKIKMSLLSKTVNCPLARLVRKNFSKKGKGDFWCVFSDELPVKPAGESLCKTGQCVCNCDRNSFNETNDEQATDWCSYKKQINGALVHITGIFGFTLASMVINDIASGRYYKNS
jgi:tRNA A37 threonylcarbamoyladenosine dehydratase